MTKKLLTLLALLMTTVFAAKADKQVYTSFDESTGTLTYYYDDQMASRPQAEAYDPVNSPNTVRFKAYDTKVTKAVIHESMKDAHLTSTYKMFYGIYKGNLYILRDGKVYNATGARVN